MEVGGTSGSSDALTIALRQERQKARAQRGHQAVKRDGAPRAHRQSQRNKSRTRVIKDGVEKARRNKSAILDEEQDSFGASFVKQSTPTKRTFSRKDEISPGGTIATGSEMSDEDKPEDSRKGRMPRLRSSRARQGVGFMKTLLRKTRSSRVPRPVETALPNGTFAILREPDVHSIDTLTVRHRNTKKPKSLPGDSDDPAILMKRARRYKKKAKRLLEQTKATDCEKGSAKIKDERVVEALARKSYRYAAESRRLFDLVRQKIDSEASDVESYDSERPASIVQKPERRQYNSQKKSSENMVYSPPMWDEDDTIQTMHTSFSEKVERDEHRRKWKELELFSAADFFGPMACGKGAELGQQYAHEAKIIVHSLQHVGSTSGDTISVMSPETVVSNETTASESALRLEHAQRMKELELFSASNVIESWNLWMRSFWTCRATTQAVNIDDDDVNRSLDGESRRGESVQTRAFCGPTILEDDVLNDDDMIIERRRYNHFMEVEDSSSCDEDESGSFSCDSDVDSSDQSQDESHSEDESGCGSSNESDDESKGPRRGVFGLLFDKY